MLAALLALSCSCATASDGLPETTAPPGAAPEATAPPGTVAGAFPPPAGYRRVEGDAFAAYLGGLSLRPPEVGVQAHNGRPITGHRARVVDLPLVPGDLQQCADSLIRLRAEWLRASGRPEEIVFHATSGDPLPYARWAKGERPYESKGRIAWRPGAQGGWDDYLAAVFMWAGTRSLALDTAAADLPAPGDLLVAPGSPGHAVVLLDVAVREETGERIVLVGEGFMPAQSFHVELGPLAGWWPYEDGVVLPHWTLPASGLRRWRP